MADPQGFEPSALRPLKPVNKGVPEHGEADLPRLSSLKDGMNCSKLAEIVGHWAFLSDEIKAAVLAIVKTSSSERGDS